jgi:hypothetical protein
MKLGPVQIEKAVKEQLDRNPYGVTFIPITKELLDKIEDQEQGPLFVTVTRDEDGLATLTLREP